MSSRKAEGDVMIKFRKSKEGVSKRTNLVKFLQFCHANIFGISQGCLRKMPIKKNNE